MEAILEKQITYKISSLLSQLSQRPKKKKKDLVT